MGTAVDPFSAVTDFMKMRDAIGQQPLSPKLFQPPEVIHIAAPVVPGGGGGVPPRGHESGPPVAVNGGGDWGKLYGALQSQFPGLRNTSGYRTPEHNREVGGVPNSNHTKKNDRGEPGAMDYVGSEREMAQAADYAIANGATEVMVHNVGSGTHLHVGFK